MISKVFAVSVVMLSLIPGVSYGLESRNSSDGPNNSEDRKFASVGFFSDVLTWQPEYRYESVMLRVSGPEGFFFEKAFESGESPIFDLARLQSSLPDGSYHYELIIAPLLSEQLRSQLGDLRDEGAAVELLNRLRTAGELSPEAQSGYFRIDQGLIVSPDLVEPLFQPAGKVNFASVSPDPNPGISFDQVIPDDLIVQSSLCVGFDCVNGENFGFDTIRLKENNLRIKFDDTSTAFGFPNVDWQLTANDSASGGANKFSIENITNARIPFTILSGAPSNSLFVDNSGRMGIGTSTPVLNAHIASGNTPALRLEQNSSGGFTAQTWDIAGNEANFFIRDVTGGSRLPFRIRPGAPTSSIDIADDGDVGLGTASPTAPLHLLRSDGTARALFEETSSTVTPRSILEVKNNGTTRIAIQNTDVGVNWFLANVTNGSFFVTREGSGFNELQLTQAGNLTVTGSMNATAFNVTSDQNLKHRIAGIDPKEILERLARMPISAWSFKTDEGGIRHVGPMAQDFHATFGLGGDDTRINVPDAAGITMAAVQGLYQLVQEKEARIQSLEARLSALEALIGSEGVPESRGQVSAGE